MGVALRDKTEYLVGRDVAVRYRDLISRCAKAHSDCYDDEQELMSSVTLRLLQYPKPIEYPEQFVRVMARNLAINKSRTGSGLWEIVESEMSDETAGETGKAAPSPQSSGLVEQILLKETLVRLERMLSPAEAKCYKLLKDGFEQADLPEKLGVSRQAVSKLMKEIRRKFLMADGVSF